MTKSIIKIEVDTYALWNSVALYEVERRDKPYIMMSSETLEKLSKAYDYSEAVGPMYIDKNKGTKERGMVANYNGCKIYVDNDIPFGQVDIR